MSFVFSWQGQRVETRAALETRDDGLTDAVVEHLTRQAQGIGNGAIEELACFEACARIIGHAFSLADIEPLNPVTEAITPQVLERIGQGFVRKGESVHELRVKEGRAILLPAATWTINGRPDPETWTYDVSLAGPSGEIAKTLPAQAIVHCRHGATDAEPWKGQGPLQKASVTASLATYLEGRLAEEVSGEVGNLLPIVGDPNDEKYNGLKSDLKSLKGRTSLVRSQVSEWGAGSTSGGPSSGQDWTPRRIGANPPAVLESLRSAVGVSVCNAVGIPPALLAPDVDATGLREAYRELLHMTVLPLAELALAELKEKLDQPALTLRFKRLAAGDIQGRSRAYMQLRNAGMDAGKAEDLTLSV